MSEPISSLRAVTAPLLLACCLLASACSLALKRGDELAAQGKWYAATEAYDEAVASDPSSPEALQGRDRARTEAIAELLRAAREATEGRRFTAAAESLAKAFMLGERWQRPDIGAAELATLHRAWAQDFSAQLDAEGPLRLSAQRGVFAQTLAHPRFAELLVSLNTAWAQVAGRRCEAALAQARAGFLRALATSYCRTAGQSASQPELPLFSESPRVDDFMRGAAGPWPVTMTQAFEASPWSWKTSTQHALVSVSGELDVAYSDQRVRKTAHWTVTVPYSTTQWVQVPYTTYQYYTYPCGRSTCSGSRPVTNYRSQPRTVTQYRQEPRTQDYEAIESRVALSAQVKMFVDLRPRARPLGLVHEVSTSETGVTHSGVPLAGMPPQQARLTTRAEWDSKQRQASQTKLIAALVEHWRDAYCNPPLADAEAAARCAFGGGTRPEERGMLDAFFKDDVSALVSQRRFGL